VGEDLIYRQAYEVAVQLLELFPPLLKGHELGSADRSEVRGMAEKHQPLAPVVAGQIDHALGGLHLYGGKLVSYQREAILAAAFHVALHVMLSVMHMVMPQSAQGSLLLCHAHTIRLVFFINIGLLFLQPTELAAMMPGWLYYDLNLIIAGVLSRIHLSHEATYLPRR